MKKFYFLKFLWHNISMQKKNLWFWLPYFAILLHLITRKTVLFFNSDSPIYMYYSILSAFSFLFEFRYLFNFIQIILNIILCIPVFLYFSNKSWGDASFWKVLFILRIAFDICGNNFELQGIIASYYVDPRYSLLLFGSLTFPYIPSYVACFKYAFGKN